MFNKLVVIEPINVLEFHKEKLKKIAKQVVFYDDIPLNDELIINRISDADAVLLSYTSYAFTIL